jgi:excisionase family DNA binding protein
VGNGMTIQEACQRLGKSEAMIRRAIKAGTLNANMIEGKYFITEQDLNAYAQPMQMPKNDDQVEFLKEQLREKDKQIEQLTKQIDQQQAIIMQLRVLSRLVL